MSGGGAKPGERRGGRKKGVKNHASIAREAAVKASGITPLEFMLAEMRNPKRPVAVRRQCARDAAPYVHPKLAAIEHSGGDNPIRHIISAEPLSEEEWANMHGTKD